MGENDWSEEEICAAVESYVEMLSLLQQSIPFSKSSYNEKLRMGILAKRSKASIEYRMQNISAVLDDLKIVWLDGYKPARNVGQGVKQIIAKKLSPYLIPDSEVENFSMRLRHAPSTQSKLKKIFFLQPQGTINVPVELKSTKVFKRDLRVKNWVLHRSGGVCEGCEKEAPFQTDSGMPFLEIHHLTTLAEGGHDTVCNTVALCPNCHRKIHFGVDREDFKKEIISRTSKQKK